MSNIALAFDVGGTNTRARMAMVRDGEGVVPAHDDIVTQARSAQELYEFVTQVVWEAQRQGTVTASVVAVAGPIVGTTSRLSNWPQDSEIDLAALELAGLPTDATDLVNDVVAGVWGALARVQSDRVEALSAHPQRPDLSAPGAGSLVYIAPGTGLGASALIHHGLGPRKATAVACEAQHTQIPRFPGEIGQVAAAAEVAMGYPPTWEDLVSGRGLVTTYDALGTLAGGQPVASAGGDERAGDIAAAALSGDDAQAVAALNVYYRALGHFAQMLALTYLPCSIVVIGGTSTEINRDLLHGSDLVETFAVHRRFADLLGAIPICAVGGDVNLEGGIWLAAHSGRQ